MHAIRQLDPATLLPSENDSLSPTPLAFEDNSSQPASPPQASSRVRPIRSSGPATIRHAEASSEEDGSRIDVMVVYTPAARDAEGGRKAIEAVVDLYVAETNQAYADSGVIQRLNLVAVSMVDYEEATSGGSSGLAGNTDRNRLQRPDDGHLDEVTTSGIGTPQMSWSSSVTIRTKQAALHPDVPGPRLGCVPEQSRVFNVVDHEASASTFAHELGHTMGLNHDRYAATRCWRCVNNPPEQNLAKWVPYPYAFGYVNQRAFEPAAPESSRWVTIMAYGLQCKDAGYEVCARDALFQSGPDVFPCS